MEFSSQDHTFIVCAYKENPYLEKCVRSVVNQSVKSRVMISTSTPNEYIKSIARKYGLEMKVNKGKGDLADNFNFAYSCCDTRFVTLCHQDDFYSRHYLQEVGNALKDVKRPIIAFTDYAEVYNGAVRKSSLVLKVKRVMLLPLCLSGLQKSRFIRRRILGFGNPVCCPSIVFNRDLIKDPEFSSAYRSSVDYELLERISRMKGSFIYCRHRLVYHRLWDGTDTQSSITSGRRSMDERKVLERLWPGFIAGVVSKVYRIAQKYYR